MPSIIIIIITMTAEGPADDSLFSKQQQSIIVINKIKYKNDKNNHNLKK